MANSGLDSAGMLQIPAQFDVTIPLVKMWQDGAGELRFEGVAASTSLDRQDERLTLAAIEKMKQYSGIELLPSHGSGVLEELGVVEKCWLDNEQFRIAGSLDASNPEAVRLYEKLKAGKQYGLSVGGRVLSAHREFDLEAGKQVKYIDDVELDHVAVCRPGSAANPDTYLTVLAKAASAVLAQEPISDDALFARLGKSIVEVCQKMWAFGVEPLRQRRLTPPPPSPERRGGTTDGTGVDEQHWHAGSPPDGMRKGEPEGDALLSEAQKSDADTVLRQAPPVRQDGENEGVEQNAAGDGVEKVCGPDDAGWQDAMLGELHRQVASLSQAVADLEKDVAADEQMQEVVPGQPQAIPGQTKPTTDKRVMWKGVL